MISIIICSKDSSLTNDLKRNISETIGVPYELIIIDNSGKQDSIFSAYNKGVKKSKFKLLCFMHEDIAFHSSEWGKKVLNHFKDEEAGMIGIAGTKYLSKIPGGWWASGLSHINILQAKDTVSKAELKLVNPANEFSTSVVVVDGVWFCIRRELFDRIHFDEETFNGYHLYDQDISLQVLQCNKKILVVYDILLEHYSKGRLDKEWINASLLFNEKWKDQLPQHSLALSQDLRITLNRRTYLDLAYWLYESKLKPSEKLSILKQFSAYCKLSLLSRTCIKILYYLLKIRLQAI